MVRGYEAVTTLPIMTSRSDKKCEVEEDDVFCPEFRP